MFTIPSGRYQWVAGVALLLAVVLTSVACKKDQPDNNDTWLIPEDEVLDGGPGKDGIPALLDPTFEGIREANEWLTNSELVVGVVQNGVAKAYPHDILDWHEIVNDEIGGTNMAVIFCPLTGTAHGWDREIEGEFTTFGVSGLLYQSNVIPFDRKSETNWSQMRMQAVNGTHAGDVPKTYQVIETSWGTWKNLFPNTTSVSRSTGHDRSYGNCPYGDYCTNDDELIFPVENVDDRLPTKDRVHGIVINGAARVYTFPDAASGTTVRQDNFAGLDVVVLSNTQYNLMLSFYNELNGEQRTFSPLNDALPALLEDDLGNTYDVTGNVISGPDTGQQLVPTKGFMGYYFAWSAFYPGLSIVN